MRAGFPRELIDAIGLDMPQFERMPEMPIRSVTPNKLWILREEMEKHGICTVFSETTVSDKLAQTVAAELEGCDEVHVLQLYTGALGPAGGGADSYVGMYRSTVDAIVEGLR